MATPIAPFRETSVVINDYLPTPVTQWFGVQRKASEMCRTAASKFTGTVYRNGIGITIQSYMQDKGEYWLQEAGQPGWMSKAGGATVGTNVTESPGFVQQNLAGVPYASFVQTEGSPMLQDKVPATSGNWAASQLAADQAAFPSANTAEDSTPMDRKYIFWNVNPWDVILVTLAIPGSRIGGKGTIAGIFINGPASVTQAAIAGKEGFGTGQYELKVRLDGRAVLYELLTDNTWKQVYGFQWRYNRGAVTVEEVTFTIGSRMWMDANGNWQGDQMFFLDYDFAMTNKGFTLVNELIGLSIAEIGLKDREKASPYMVPQVQPSTKFTLAPVRLDLAREVRAKFYLVRSVYLATGSVTDDWISTEMPLDYSNPIGNPLVLTWQGMLPTGCTWVASIVDQHGTTLVPINATPYTTTVDTGQRASMTFKTTATSDGGGITAVQVTFTETSENPNHFSAPILIEYQLTQFAQFVSTENPLSLVTVPSRDSSSQSGANPFNGLTLPQTTVGSVSIHPQETDPGAETATIVVEDVVNQLEFLDNSQMRPILVQTTYDEGLTNQASLFRGYIRKATRKRQRGDGYEMNGTTPKNYGGILRSTYTLDCVGQWARDYRTGIFPRRWPFKPTNPDYASSFPLVTDVIFAALSMIYPTSILDIPSSDIPIMSSDPTLLIAEPGQRVPDFVSRLAYDFLGSYFLFDESAGDQGMQRLLPQKVPPYNNLANFTFNHPTVLWDDGIWRLPHILSAYPTQTVSGQLIQTVPVFADSLTTYRDPSEGNAVVVFGGGINQDAASAGSQGAILLTQCAVKVDAFNFLNLPSDNPNYPNGSSPEFENCIVPIKVEDFTLPTQRAVDFKCRRIYDHACWSQYYIAFTAPMVLVTDVTDDLQQRPRRLRYYDAVTCQAYDNSTLQCLVVGCYPAYRKDTVQMAHYVLMTQGNINDIMVAPPSQKSAEIVKKLLQRLIGDGNPYADRSTSRANQSKLAKSAMMGLPSTTGDPIQDLNPNSDTYGEFYYLVGYDAVGTGIVS